MANCHSEGRHSGRLLEQRCPCGWSTAICTRHADGETKANRIVTRRALKHAWNCGHMSASRATLIWRQIVSEREQFPPRPLYRCACGVTVEDRERERHSRQFHEGDVSYVRRRAG